MTKYELNIGDVLMGVATKLLIEAGWEQSKHVSELFRKDDHELLLTPTIAFALWDTYGVGGMEE